MHILYVQTPIPLSSNFNHCRGSRPWWNWVRKSTCHYWRCHYGEAIAGEIPLLRTLTMGYNTLIEFDLWWWAGMRPWLTTFPLRHGAAAMGSDHAYSTYISHRTGRYTGTQPHHRNAHINSIKLLHSVLVQNETKPGESWGGGCSKIHVCSNFFRPFLRPDWFFPSTKHAHHKLRLNLGANDDTFVLG